MQGLVIPSKMQQDQARQAARTRDLVGLADPPNGVTPIGNGMGVDTRGNVVLIPEQYGGGKAPGSQMEAEDLVARLMDVLDKRGIPAANINRNAPPPQSMRVSRATDPMIAPQPYYRPGDFTTEFGIPVDTTEIIALCEEISAYSAIPEVINGSNTDSWLEMNALYFTGGANFVAFENGGCPEEYTASTVNRTVPKKHIGAKKTLSQSDIVHSMASIAAGYGVTSLVGPTGWQNTDGSEGPASFVRATVGDAKEKEIRRMMTLTINGWDELLVKGSVSANPEEFDGIETLVTSGNGARVNFDKAVYSGSFSVARFDEWLAAGCAKPTHVFGHPAAIQALKLAYWSLGANASAPQVVTGANGAIVAGATFANVIQTSIGQLTLVPDARFSRTDHGNGTFTADLYALRLAHNGEPLVYKATQLPLNYKDLAPGCSAISFLVWAVTALTIKHMCAQGQYRARFSGLVDDGCLLIHPDTNPAGIG
jgi:hypothetical protein